MNAFIAGLPLWVRKFAVDAIEGAVAALFAMDFVFPTTVPASQTLFVAAGVAIAGALVSAARRALPDAFAWLASKFGTAPA